jgi:hypothetical protein
MDSASKSQEASLIEGMRHDTAPWLLVAMAAFESFCVTKLSIFFSKLGFSPAR